MNNYVNNNIYLKLTDNLINFSHEDFIYEIYQNRKYINIINDFGEGLLHYYCYHGEIEKYEALLNFGCPVFKTFSGNTLLHYALNGGKDEYITLELIKTGHSPLDRNNRGETPIHLASSEASCSFLNNWLTINKYDLNSIRDLNNNTPAHTAKMYAKIDSFIYWCACGLANTLNDFNRKPSEIKFRHFDRC